MRNVSHFVENVDRAMGPYPEDMWNGCTEMAQQMVFEIDETYNGTFVPTGLQPTFCDADADEVTLSAHVSTNSRRVPEVKLRFGYMATEAYVEPDDLEMNVCEA